MKANIKKWLILLLALVCAVQAASAFTVKTETINPASGALESGQQVNARYVLTYDMDDRNLNDETLEFSTGLQNAVWDFTVYRDGVAIYTTKKTGFYPVLTEFELSYGDGNIELDALVRGTVPSTGGTKVLIAKIDHMRDKDVKDTHSLNRDVVSVASTTIPTTIPTATSTPFSGETGAAVPTQSWSTTTVSASFDVKSETVNPANGALEPGQQVTAQYVLAYEMDDRSANDESFKFSTALSNPTWDFTIYRDGIAIYTTKKTGYYPVLTEFELAYGDGNLELDVQLRGTVPSNADEKILVTRIEHLQNNRVKSTFSLNRDILGVTPTTVSTVAPTPISGGTGATAAAQLQPTLTSANPLLAKVDEGFNFGGSLLLYVGLGVMIAVVLLTGYFLHSRRNGRSTQNRRSKSSGGQPPAGLSAGQTPRCRDATISPGRTDLSTQNGRSRSLKKSADNIVLPEEDSIKSTAKPDISIKLSHANSYADEWDKIELTLVNAGTANAFDITLTFSNDVDTRLLRPVDLAAGESRTIEAGIKPRTRGTIPLEITARYRDATNRVYKQTTSLWLTVESRNDLASPGSSLPPSISRPVTSKSLPPEVVDRYTTSEFMGKGGFARVFKVQKLDGSWAALKIPITLDAATGKSFIAELQNWTSMVHENIVRVEDYNIMPLPYFEMELCDGTLATLERPAPPDHAAWLLFNVCEGLKYAHARGILHRDLKPQNIMLKEGMPKISDWGLSKVMTQSRTTTVSGGFTAYYAAPEQIINKPKDQRTDIWQLGVIAYELVTGQLPFIGESMVEIGMAIATKEPERPGAVHPDAQPLDTIILKCLEKSPEQRYQSVVDLQKDLAMHLKMNYTRSLGESIRVNDLQRSAYYCGDLVLISMKIGDLVAAYRYANDLIRYSTGDIRTEATELAKQIEMMVEMEIQELPNELIRKAEVLVYQIRMK